MSKSKIVLKMIRGHLHSMHRIKGDVYDVTMGIVPKRKPRRKRERNMEVPIMIDSRIEPGLIFHMIKMVVTYEKSDKLLPPPPKKTWQILLCLESYGGKVSEEELVAECWEGDATPKAVQRAIESASQYLMTMGVTKMVFATGDDVKWE